MTAVVLTGELEHWLRRTIEPDLLGQLRSASNLSGAAFGRSRPAANRSGRRAGRCRGARNRAGGLGVPPTFARPAADSENHRTRSEIAHPNCGGGHGQHTPLRALHCGVQSSAHHGRAGAFQCAAQFTRIFCVGPHAEVSVGGLVPAPIRAEYLRGEQAKGDRQAFGCALAVLKAEAHLTIAPEGRISHAPEDCSKARREREHSSLDVQALRIVPLVQGTGQEDFGRCLRRSQAAPRRMVRVGMPINFQGGNLGYATALEGCTDHDDAGARPQMLPPRYRGFLCRAVEAGSAMRIGRFCGGHLRRPPALPPGSAAGSWLIQRPALRPVPRSYPSPPGESFRRSLAPGMRTL